MIIFYSRKIKAMLLKIKQSSISFFRFILNVSLNFFVFLFAHIHIEVHHKKS